MIDVLTWLIKKPIKNSQLPKLGYPKGMVALAAASVSVKLAIKTNCTTGQASVLGFSQQPEGPHKPIFSGQSQNNCCRLHGEFAGFQQPSLDVAPHHLWCDGWGVS